MSDYQELCEMYGADASDPDFIDWLIDDCGKGKEYKLPCHFQSNGMLPSGRLVHMVKLTVSSPAKPIAAKFHLKLPCDIGFSKANTLKHSDLDNPGGWFVDRGFTVHSMKENGYWYQLAYKRNNELTKLTRDAVIEYGEFSGMNPDESDFFGNK